MTAKEGIASACRVLAAAAVLLGVHPAAGQSGGAPGDYWLRVHGLGPYDWWLDHDGDGFPALSEYAAGTSPFDGASFLRAEFAISEGEAALQWESAAGAVYRVGTSASLDDWLSLGATFAGDGARLEATVSLDAEEAFFRLEVLEPGDADGDGLSDLEELLFLGTDPTNADTDGDGLEDGVEVFRTFTDPLTPDEPGGSVIGVVFNDPDGDGDLSDGSPVEGAVVFLDLNFDGELGIDEPTVTTGADGRYAFTYLRPGLYHLRQNLPPATLQTLPGGGVSPAHDGLADEVVEYVHSDAGALEVPYGRMADPWKGLNAILFPLQMAQRPKTWRYWG